MNLFRSRAMLGAVLLTLGSALLGCQAPHSTTQTQMDALQVREVEVGADRAFAAASSALFDAGYQVHVSDSDAGLMTGEKREDPAVAADVAVVVLTAILSRGYAAQDIPLTYHAVSIQVIPGGPNRSSVRIRPFLNGWACACDEADPAGRKIVQELWSLMQRQVLMKEPSPAAAQPSTPATGH